MKQIVLSILMFAGSVFGENSNFSERFQKIDREELLHIKEGLTKIQNNTGKYQEELRVLQKNLEIINHFQDEVLDKRKNEMSLIDILKKYPQNENLKIVIEYIDNGNKISDFIEADFYYENTKRAMKYKYLYSLKYTIEDNEYLVLENQIFMAVKEEKLISQIDLNNATEYVTKSNVNIRSLPFILNNKNLLGGIKKGSFIKFLGKTSLENEFGEKSTWFFVETEDFLKGWVNSKHLRKIINTNS